MTSSPVRDREIALYDLGQASLQMMVAAADLGIGSGHSAVGDQDLARQVLGLPADKILKYIIDFGYPADRPLKPIKKPNRRPVRRGRAPRQVVSDPTRGEKPVPTPEKSPRMRAGSQPPRALQALVAFSNAGDCSSIDFGMAMIIPSPASIEL